ncbi:hypothetical protein MKX03_019369 [Papaver bracteatum]|nr:hypothetical protein MKX03_019369 [Papaver bracteatum]
MATAFAFAFAFALEFEKKADKKVNGMGNAWNKAAKVYLNLAGCHLKLGSKHEAALAYADAAYCCERICPKVAAISCYNQAVNMFKEIGRFDMAAIYCKEIGRVYEFEQELENSIVYLKKAADLFPTSANQYMHKVAQLYAQLEQYPRAIEIFEHLAKQSLNDNRFKNRVKGYLLNAGLCHLYGVAIFKALERYEAMDPTFSKTREYKLLAHLAAAASVYEVDVQRFMLSNNSKSTE